MCMGRKQVILQHMLIPKHAQAYARTMLNTLLARDLAHALQRAPKPCRNTHVVDAVVGRARRVAPPIVPTDGGAFNG